MSKLLSKHLHLCFFKLKHHTTILSPTPSPPSTPTTTSKSTTSNYFSSSSSSDDVDPPDLASLFASERFFFSSPGTSNSIIESPDTRASIPSGGVKVPKYSVDPYVDFLRSMQEMIASRKQTLDVSKDWEYLHDLLLCYLALNPSHTHRYIVRAFTDLVVDLLSSSSSLSSPPVVKSSSCRRLKNHRRRHSSSFSGQLV
ncbi:hypothetical protein PIB30_018283 [Stylosanthes scabra]|uniref:Transcription repressor n=1 Tax=Stylosanthes scabra TaxID=79078 RepID=A0ABU6Y6G0_9FABA|nr:hypothetical protein [Stylosanthes scabra]